MPTILIADDVASVRRILSLTFTGQYMVIEAADGLEALMLAEQHHPDVAILDVAMPGLNGLEVCRLLRRDPNLSRIGIIIHSASSSDAAARQAGADRFLPKPSLPSQIRAAVDDLTQAQGGGLTDD
jgi:CheY-like chemotaxis protein